MEEQYRIELFQPTPSTWCADVYRKEIGCCVRIFCGKGWEVAIDALAEAAEFLKGNRNKR